MNSGIPFTTELVPGGGYSLLWPLRGGSNVYERVGKSVIYFGAVKGRKRAKLELAGAFYGFAKVEEIFWFCDLFIFWRQCIYSP